MGGEFAGMPQYEERSYAQRRKVNTNDGQKALDQLTPEDR